MHKWEKDRLNFVEHEYCLRCRRVLKNPKARKLGYGATCYAKTKQENSLYKLVIEESDGKC